MFELSVACKYLIPRWRQLSVSIISLISILVIALVVWLIVVFFSVTNGLEKNWVLKLTALTAPVRVSPTDAYYQSYYHQIDALSSASDYSLKSIKEKFESEQTNPYDEETDQELPSTFPAPDLDSDGHLKDLVKPIYSAADQMNAIDGLKISDFEITATQIHLNLFRNAPLLRGQNIFNTTNQSSLSYPAYLGNFDENNDQFKHPLLPLRNEDYSNLLSLLMAPSQPLTQDANIRFQLTSTLETQKKIQDFFHSISVSKLKTREAGWVIPSTVMPKNASWKVAAISKDGRTLRVFIPADKAQLDELVTNLANQGLKVQPATLVVDNDKRELIFYGAPSELLSPHTPLTLAGNTSFSVQLIESSLESAKQLTSLEFQAEIPVQNNFLTGIIYLRGLDIAEAVPIQTYTPTYPLSIQPITDVSGRLHFKLPSNQPIGEAVILPKGFRDSGVRVGDKGTLSYLSPTASMMEEQLVPVYVGGFYDPGIIPIGGKFILASSGLTSLIRSHHQSDDTRQIDTNGINIRFNNLADADKVKKKLQNILEEKGISRYWTVETYQDYEFTKEMMQELQSQKNLFMLISIVIIIVACSNIISMLIILVNDKKAEIGILRSMGASHKNIAAIFAIAGAVIAVFGSLIGMISALITLQYLETLVSLLSTLQGHDMFSSSIYGQVLPSELSFEALSFVLLATLFISLVAAIVPAIKACMLRPSELLK